VGLGKHRVTNMQARAEGRGMGLMSGPGPKFKIQI
jgi:hypothetical protein